MKEGGGSLMHVYVLNYIVSLCYRTTWWMFTKLGRVEVLVALHLWLDFGQTLPRGGFRAGQKYVNEGSLLQRTADSDWKATVTKRMHCNDLKACGKKCCYFWFHSEVQFLTRFWRLFGLSHFCVFRCNFYRFLCGKVLYLHWLCVMSMFIIGRMLI